MTIARTAAWVLTALIFGPLAAAMLAAGMILLRFAWRNERTHRRHAAA